MKKLALLPLLLLGVALIPASHGAGVYADQQLMVNPFMTGEDYTGWSPISPWRNNGTGDSQVFDFNIDGPTGFFLTNQATVDITTTGAHTADPDYDPNTARLTDIQFNGIFLGRANETNASGTLDANFFIEFTINTTSLDYRARSSGIEDPWTQTPGTFLATNADYTWLTDATYSGDPFATGGIVLNDITGLTANYFMQVVTNNAGGAGTVFSTIDNASIQYEVTVVPEPSAVVMLGLGVFALAMRRRR